MNMRGCEAAWLTICTGAIPNDKPFLETNWRLVTRLNPAHGWEWVVVVDNDEGPATQDKIVQLGDERCRLVQGLEFTMKGGRSDADQLRRGSYHHAAALTKTLGYVRTRFVLLLDPDFYIVRPAWMEEVVGYMIQCGLALFGVPWHPRWLTKYRYFPCLHCLFIDLEQIPVDRLDVSPGFAASGGPGTQSQEPLESLKQRIPSGVRRLVRPLARALWFDRQSIGGSPDNGYKLFQRFGGNGRIRYECPVPVFRPRVDFRGPAYALSWPNWLLERLLPDRLCFLPKRRGSYTQVGFCELGHFDVASKGWEEFMWQGRPFGFHLRRTRQGTPDTADELMTIQEAIDSFTPEDRHGA
jgi:hypothetical protein